MGRRGASDASPSLFPRPWIRLYCIISLSWISFGGLQEKASQHKMMSQAGARGTDGDILRKIHRD